MKKNLLLLMMVFISSFAVAQLKKIDSIYVNLYTDSLKKGTYNYINVDGLLSNGHYYPLDSNYILFTSSAGKFVGNNLWIDNDFKEQKVRINIVLKSNASINKTFEMYIKTKPDGQLKTVEEILNKPPKKVKKKNDIL